MGEVDIERAPVEMSFMEWVTLCDLLWEALNAERALYDRLLMLGPAE